MLLVRAVNTFSLCVPNFLIKKPLQMGVSDESLLRPGVTLEKASTMPCWTGCFWLCPSRGEALCSNTSGGCIDFRTNTWFECMTMWMLRYQY